MSMKVLSRIILLVLSSNMLTVHAQQWSEKLAATCMSLWPDSLVVKPNRPAQWTYDQGVILKGIEGVWKRTADPKYFRYIQKSMDFFVQPNGTIRTYKLEDYNIDNVNNGRILLFLYNVTGLPKYNTAASILRQQLTTHPRTNEGGFWHKKVYPYQMWLDGLYMGEPFYAEYSKLHNDYEAFNDIAKQFILMEKNAVDPTTGLLYHGYDESRQQQWADKTTGRSPNFWGRSMGWYAMALADALDHFPADHPKRDSVISILQRLARAVTKVQDKKTGLWWQVLDKGGEKGNYLEASASSMFVYALAKGVRKGYLDRSYFNVAQKGYDGIIKNLISTDAKGMAHLNKTCQVAGLGGNPYRSGSYEYYINEPVITDDPKGLGAFIQAAVEMEIAKDLPVARGKKVMLDYYFNNERRKDPDGRMVRFHYNWEDQANSGFSFFGGIFESYGARLDSLTQAPTPENLKGTDVYIIVDPDFEKENPKPNFIQPADAKAITDWVKVGGVLALFSNDTGNVEFKHFNELAKNFGMRFNENSLNRVTGTNFDTGKVFIPVNQPIFKNTKKVYIKELSSINVTPPAKAIVTANGNVIMAIAKVGKGTVFAVGDPWLYNEYVDGRKIPAEYQNFSAAKELAKWLLQQSAVSKK